MDPASMASSFSEHPDWMAAWQWRPSDPVLWCAADTLDPPRLEWTQHAQLYNLDAVAYESVLLGLWSICWPLAQLCWLIGGCPYARLFLMRRLEVSGRALTYVLL